MKQLIVFLIINFVFTHSFTQEWAPVGSKWIYSRSIMDYDNIEIYESISDTLIEGKICRKIVSYHINSGINSPIESVNYLYSEGNRVYFYKWGQFNLVFDFTLQLGENFIAVGPSDQFNAGQFELNHIETYPINGNNFNHFFYQPYDNLFFFEGILDQVGGYTRFFPDAQGAYPPEHDYLQCYITGDSIYYPANNSEYCNYYRTLKISEISQTGLRFSPNPVSYESQLDIPLEFGEIREVKITSLSGQSAGTYTLENRKLYLQKPDFPAGLYFIEVQTENQRLFGKFIVE